VPPNGPGIPAEAATIADRVEPLMIVIRLNNATPIIKADAVAAVRSGFRKAFWRPNAPGSPAILASGPPTALAA
jgi:hypothetical protein